MTIYSVKRDLLEHIGDVEHQFAAYRCHVLAAVDVIVLAVGLDYVCGAVPVFLCDSAQTQSYDGGNPAAYAELALYSAHVYVGSI